jgi:hypothetical protein
MSYFLISVSNKENLELCKKYGLAGFTNSINGLWTFSEIQEGDYISFLYGAKVNNLYQVKSKEAIKNAISLPPWEPITFKMSGITYYFPFRLQLSPVRSLGESLVRAEFAYVAENLLLRGGYRKTHFQADQTTLQSVSQLGDLYTDTLEKLDYNSYEIFIPRFTKSTGSPPEVFRFSELILQSAIRQHLSEVNISNNFFNQINLDAFIDIKLDVLGEKALPQGHIDILIKEAVPIGSAKTVVIEVKTGIAKLQDVNQLNEYLGELGNECLSAILIAKDFSKKVLAEAQLKKIQAFSYTLGMLDNNQFFSFSELKRNLKLTKVNY